MLQRWSNDLFKSTIHRVLNIKGRDRYSIPFFFEPNFDCLVECISTCVSEGSVSKYAPIKSGDYLLMRYNETHAAFEA